MKLIQSIIFLIIYSNAYSQKSSIGVNFGLVYGDALARSAQLFPGISLEYKYSIGKLLKLKVGTGLYKLTFGEGYNESLTYPVLENNHSRLHPFISTTELLKLQSQGFRLNPTFLTYYQTSVPLEAGLLLAPINSKHHSLSLGATAGYMYSNLNHWRDQLPGDLKVNDKTYQITLLINTEYRRFYPTFSGSVSYEYKFSDYAIGVEWKNYNFFIFNTGSNPPLWITNLKLGYHF